MNKPLTTIQQLRIMARDYPQASDAVEHMLETVKEFLVWEAQVKTPAMLLMSQSWRIMLTNCLGDEMPPPRMN